MKKLKMPIINLKINGDIMNYYRKFVFGALLYFISVIAFAENTILVNKISNSDGSEWVVERKGVDYNLKYVNKNDKVYDNKSIITSDVADNDLFISSDSSGNISVSIHYPRDVYMFEFSSGETPYLIFACKQIKLPSINHQQAVELLTLCSKKDSMKKLNLSNINADRVLEQNNLFLMRKIKTTIGSDKSFLYNENKIQKLKKPYLIKGDQVEILDHSDSYLKVSYSTGSKKIIGWIKYSDIL